MTKQTNGQQYESILWRNERPFLSLSAMHAAIGRPTALRPVRWAGNRGAAIVAERAAAGFEAIGKDKGRQVWADWEVARRYAADAALLYGHKADPQFVKWATSIPKTPPTMDAGLASLGRFLKRWFPPTRAA